MWPFSNYAGVQNKKSRSYELIIFTDIEEDDIRCGSPDISILIFNEKEKKKKKKEIGSFLFPRRSAHVVRMDKPTPLVVFWWDNEGARQVL